MRRQLAMLPTLHDSTSWIVCHAHGISPEPKARDLEQS